MKSFLIIVVVALAAVAIVEFSAMTVDAAPNNVSFHHHKHNSSNVTCDPVTNSTSNFMKLRNSTCNFDCVVSSLFKQIHYVGCLMNGTCECYNNNRNSTNTTTTTTAVPTTTNVVQSTTTTASVVP